MICPAFSQSLPKVHFLLHFNFNNAFYYGGGNVQKQAFPFVPARYIRTFDVIPAVNYVFLRTKRMLEKIPLCVNF